jgi:hypothetical protein
MRFAVSENVDAQTAPRLGTRSLHALAAGRRFALGAGSIALAAAVFFLARLTAWRMGGGGQQLGSTGAVADFAWQVAGDFSSGRRWLLIAVLVLAAIGAANVPRETLTLALCLAGVPAVAFLAARLHAAASPQPLI